MVKPSLRRQPKVPVVWVALLAAFNGLLLLALAACALALGGSRIASFTATPPRVGLQEDPQPVGGTPLLPPRVAVEGTARDVILSVSEGEVLRAVRLERELLLVLLVPSNTAPLLRKHLRSLSRSNPEGPSLPLGAPSLPLACAFAPGNDEPSLPPVSSPQGLSPRPPELLPLTGLTARGRIAFARCALPGSAQGLEGRRVTLALLGSHPSAASWGEGRNTATGTHPPPPHQGDSAGLPKPPSPLAQVTGAVWHAALCEHASSKDAGGLASGLPQAEASVAAESLPEEPLWNGPCRVESAVWQLPSVASVGPTDAAAPPDGVVPQEPPGRGAEFLGLRLVMESVLVGGSPLQGRGGTPRSSPLPAGEGRGLAGEQGRLVLFARGVFWRNKFRRLFPHKANISCVFSPAWGTHETPSEHIGDTGLHVGQHQGGYQSAGYHGGRRALGLPVGGRLSRSTWKAFPLVAAPGKALVIVCPLPPKGIVQLWLANRGVRPPSLSSCGMEGSTRYSRRHVRDLGDQRLNGSMPGCGEASLVSVTVEDSFGLLPSVAIVDMASLAAAGAGWQQGGHKPYKAQVRRQPGRVAVHGAGSGDDTSTGADKRFFLCSCTMVMNAAKLLREWVSYHSWMGVEHFFVYDNNSDDDLLGTVWDLFLGRQTGADGKASTSRSGSDQVFGSEVEATEVRGGPKEEAGGGEGDWASPVTLIPWPWLKTQQAGFSHCLLKAAPLCSWVMFTDVDEFLVPSFADNITSQGDLRREREAKGAFLHSWIRQLEASVLPKRLGMVEVPSLRFGPSGRKLHPAEGVSLGYTCRLKAQSLGKVLVRPEAVGEELGNTVHVFDIGWRYLHLKERAEGARIHHYQYQAWGEYKNKFTRRAAAGVRDWGRGEGEGKEGTGQGVEANVVEREDGVVLCNGTVAPPRDWDQRFCEVHDNRLAKLVRLLLESKRGAWKGLLG